VKSPGVVRESLVSARDLYQFATDRRGPASHHRKDPAALATVRTDGLGDLILWMPAAAMLREAFGDARQVLIVRKEWADLCEAVGLWDEVVGIDTRGMRTTPAVRDRELARLDSQPCEAILNPMAHMYFSDGEAVVRRLTATRRVGVRLSGWGWRGHLRDRLYDDLLDPSGSDWHFDRNRELADEAARLIQPDRVAMKAVDGHPLRALGERLTGAEQGAHPAGDARYVALFTRTGLTRRNPDPSLLGQVVRRLLAETDRHVVVLDSAPGAILAESFEGERRVNHVQTDSLVEIVRIVSLADLVIGGDSGGSHMAAALGRPTIVVLGGGHHGRFFPYGESWPGPVPHVLDHPMECFGCDWQCTVAPDGDGSFPCIQKIGADALWERVLPLLA